MAELNNNQTQNQELSKPIVIIKIADLRRDFNTAIGNLLNDIDQCEIIYQLLLALTVYTEPDNCIINFSRLSVDVNHNEKSLIQSASVDFLREICLVLDECDIINYEGLLDYYPYCNVGKDLALQYLPN